MGLPRYDDPPVAEVVFSAQFEPVNELTPVHLGWWWDDERRAIYPTCEEHPRVESSIEGFQIQAAPSFSFTVEDTPPTPALWFLTKNRDQLVQIQRDRLTRNWRRQDADEDGAYPSYSTLRPRFADELTSFEGFLVERALTDALHLTQCELLYVNPIAADQVWASHSELASLFAPWSGELTEAFLPPPEDVQMVLRFRIPHEGEPIGRLVVTLTPVFDPNGSPIYLLNMSARGRPVTPNIDGVMTFFDIAHEWIVRGFTTLTTPEMHRRWRRHADDDS